MTAGFAFRGPDVRQVVAPGAVNVLGWRQLL